MKINWVRYQQCILEMRTNDSTNKIAEIIHEMVKTYLFLDSNDVQISKCVLELKQLGILIPTETTPTEERRNIVQPFNFMGDGTQSS